MTPMSICYQSTPLFYPSRLIKMKFNQLKKSDEKMFSFQNLYILRSGLKNYIVYLSTVAMQKALLLLDNIEKRPMLQGVEKKIDSDGDVNLKQKTIRSHTFLAHELLDFPPPHPVKAPGTGAIFKGSGVTRTLANFREYEMKHYL